MRIELLVTGRSYHLAAAVPPALELSEGSTVDDALAVLQRNLSAEAQFATSSLLALAGRHLGTIAAHENATLRDGDELVILAPVSGG